MKANRKAAARKIPLASDLAVQAASNGAHLHTGRFAEATVPNPLGEVVVNGAPRQHRALRRVRPYAALYHAGTIGRAEMAALEWFDDQAARAESGMVRCALGAMGQGGGGGESGAALPISDMVLRAASEVAWAHGVIGADLLPVFTAVMQDELTLIDAARRQCAGRYLRVSVRHRRRQLARDFKAAAARLAAALQDRDGARPGRIRVGRW